MGNRSRREDPVDESRCTRTGKGWRCHNQRHPGRVYCERHHSLYLARLQKSKASKPTSDHLRRPRRPPAPPPDLVDDSLSPAPGQIWASPAPPDALPRAYARLDRLLPGAAAAATAAEVTPLDPDDPLPPHAPGTSAPPSCGAFRPSGSTVIREISAFSHRMIAREERKDGSGGVYTILPRRGEVWAVHHGWDDAERRPVFRLVEVLSDFSEEDGTTVAAVAPVEGSSVILGRHLYEGFELLRAFSRTELALFSHRIPVCRVDDDGKDGASRGSWKIVFRFILQVYSGGCIFVDTLWGIA